MRRRLAPAGVWASASAAAERQARRQRSAQDARSSRAIGGDVGADGVDAWTCGESQMSATGAVGARRARRGGAPNCSRAGVRAFAPAADLGYKCRTRTRPAVAPRRRPRRDPRAGAARRARATRTARGPMFGFLTQPTKDHADPLQSPKSASAWLRQLPALDVIGRQQHVMRAFDGMRQSRKPVDLSRVAAIEYLDAALGADRRQLIKQYVENADGAAQARRAHLAGDRTSWRRASSYAYQTLLEQALRAAAERALEAGAAAAVRAARPLLRHRRQAARVPLRALDPGQVDASCTALPARRRARRRPRRRRRSPSAGPERDAVDGRAGIPVRAAGPPAQHRQPVAVRARLGQRRSCARGAGGSRSTPCRGRPRASSSTSPASAGLARRTGNDSGSMLRYLDTTPLAEQLERAIARAAPGRGDRPGPGRRRSTSSASRSWRRCARRSRRICNADLRRDPRIAVHGAGAGCASAWRASATSSRRRTSPSAGDPMAAAEQIEVYAVADGPRVRAPRARRARLARGVEPLVVLRSDVAGQGPQRRRPAHRGVGRHRPEPDARRAGRRAPVATCPTGCSASCGA